jgi:hypothetical protein
MLTDKGIYVAASLLLKPADNHLPEFNPIQEGISYFKIRVLSDSRSHSNEKSPRPSHLNLHIYYIYDII